MNKTSIGQQSQAVMNEDDAKNISINVIYALGTVILSFLQHVFTNFRNNVSYGVHTVLDLFKQ